MHALAGNIVSLCLCVCVCVSGGTGWLAYLCCRCGGSSPFTSAALSITYTTQAGFVCSARHCDGAIAKRHSVCLSVSSSVRPSDTYPGEPRINALRYFSHDTIVSWRQNVPEYVISRPENQNKILWENSLHPDQILHINFKKFFGGGEWRYL